MSTIPAEEKFAEEAGPKKPEAAKLPEGLTARQAIEAAFKKLQNLEAFRQKKDELEKHLDAKLDHHIAKGAAMLARFVESTNLPPGTSKEVANDIKLNERLAANTARFEAALRVVKSKITNAAGDHTREHVASAEREEKAQPGSPEKTAEERERAMEEAGEKRTSVLKDALSTAADLLPFAGGAKMTAEAFAGKTATGEKMTGRARTIHGVMGVASLALDFTGIGEAGKAVGLVGKSVEFVGKMGVKLGERGALQAAELFAKTAAFMAEHPEAVVKAEQWAEGKIREHVTAQVKNIADYRDGKRPVASKKTPPTATGTPLQQAA